MALSFSWTVIYRGWSACTVGDDRASVEIHASRVRAGPGDLLGAVAHLVLGDTDARAEFEAEPSTYRWIFRRVGDSVDIQILELPDFRHPDGDGTQAWASRQPLGTLARAVIRAFDQVAWKHGDDGYQDTWGEPFPRPELEALRTAWRNRSRDRRLCLSREDRPPGRRS
jgi:hypothetical protein